MKESSSNENWTAVKIKVKDVATDFDCSIEQKV